MRRLLLTLLIALVPATADAATVELEVDPGSGDRYSSSRAIMIFAAEAGEANDVHVTERGTTLRITDVVPLRLVGDHCSAVDQHTVECDHASWVDLSLGDGNDRLRCEDFCVVMGGDGDDVIETAGSGFLHARGESGADVLRGGPGQDELRGGYGADVLEGGGFHDFLEGDEPGPPFSPDRLDGGEGIDTAAYPRSTPVKVTVGVGGGAPGEGDVITGVETLQGSTAADVLTGDEGPNRLEGGGGNDRLIGLGGDDALRGGNGRELLDGGDGADTLMGERGPDRYVGGAGDDRLFLAMYPRVPREPQAALDCGAGNDLVDGPHARDRLTSACESVEVDGLRLTRLHGPLGFRVHFSSEYMSCPGRLVASHRGRSLARRIRTHRRGRVRFPGFSVAAVTVKVRPCWPGGDRRRDRTMGRFRVVR